ncbi:MAG: minor capsid protein [Clostridia bacterium]|jgi:SPP1 gp7 family putative phage head morphogenesis protein|nr:minor capsid protein [Clostridia bacterium]MCI2014055.1 minor capsid protein [Clostridia bacterium]
MKNAEYWRNRQEILQNNLMKKADDLIPEMQDKYEAVINDIDKEIQSFYERFAKNESLTMADAKKILSSDERKRFQMDLKEYIKKGEENGISADWEKQLESASDIHRIDRLRALQMQMREKVEELSGYKQNTMDKTLADVYKEGYYQNVFEIQKYVGTGSAFATLDQNKIDKVLAKPWTYDNQTYSDKIWQNRDRLNYALDKALTQGIIRGQAPDKVSRQIAKELNMELSNTKRLVLTESAAFSSMASQDSYKELGVEKVEYLATLDDKTCEICGPMDGQVFDMKDFEMSVNAPPLYPNCRCTTVPYFNDEFTQDEKRAARDSEGKSYTVPGNITYQQWKEKYVDNANGSGIIKSTNEAFRHKGYTHRNSNENGQKIIDTPAYNKIVGKIIKRGANIQIADENWIQHLKEQNATAVTIGDTIIFRPDATISDVLEETHHFMQNATKMNDDKEEYLRTILNEIDAKKYLLSNTGKYKIPLEEVELTKSQLEFYENQLEEYKEKLRGDKNVEG